MRPLIDREAFHRAHRRYWEQTWVRSVIGFGAFWGISMWAVGVLVLGVTGDLSRHDVLVVGLLCAVGGMLAAAAVEEWSMPAMWRKQLRLIDRIYDEDPAIVAPPPDAADYSLRLPCDRALGRRGFVGGVLYLGSAGMVFIPHVTHAPELRHPLRIEPTGSIAVDPVLLVPTLLERLLGRRIELLLVAWDDHAALFRVPETAETRRRMERALRGLEPG